MDYWKNYYRFPTIQQVNNNNKTLKLGLYDIKIEV